MSIIKTLITLLVLLAHLSMVMPSLNSAAFAHSSMVGFNFLANQTVVSQTMNATIPKESISLPSFSFIGEIKPAIILSDVGDLFEALIQTISVSVPTKREIIDAAMSVMIALAWYEQVLLFAWFVLLFSVMTTIAYLARVQRRKGNQVPRTLALPMSETYLQIIPYGCRTMVPFNNISALVLYGCRAMVPFNNITALVVYSCCRAMVPFNNITALVVYGCSAMVPTSSTTALVQRTPGTLTVYCSCRDIVLRSARTLANYVPRDMSPLATPQENKAVLTSCLHIVALISALCTSFQDGIKSITDAIQTICDFIAGAFQRLYNLRSSVVEEQQQEKEEEEPQQEQEKVPEIEIPEVSNWQPQNGAMTSLKRKLAKKDHAKRLARFRAGEIIFTCIAPGKNYSPVIYV